MATTNDSTVVAVFDDAEEARAAAADLKAAGISSDRIYVSSENAGSATAGTSGTTGYAHHEGGITGWFKSLFGGEEHEHTSGYQTAYSGGKTIVSVEAEESNVSKIADILDRHSPVDVHTDDYGTARGVGTPNTYDAGYQGSKSDVLNARTELAGATAGLGAAAARGAATTTGSAGVPKGTTAGAGTQVNQQTAQQTSQAIPVVEEELQVGKRAVQRGGVRVYSRITETPVEEQVRLREEHVRVDRQPVNREATEADFRAGRDQVIEVTEYAEQPVVAKQARVVEEVRVGKEATERTETIRDSVRRSDVEVENLTGSTSGQGYDDSDFRKHFSTAFPGGTAKYDDYAPAYRYGYEAANDPRYKGRDYSQIESDLRSDYAKRYPNSTWDRMKDSVQYGWNKVTGKTSAASNTTR